MANKRWQPVAGGSGGVSGSEMAKMAPTEERLQWQWRWRIWWKGNDDHVSKGGRMQGDNSDGHDMRQQQQQQEGEATTTVVHEWGRQQRRRQHNAAAFERPQWQDKKRQQRGWRWQRRRG